MRIVKIIQRRSVLLKISIFLFLVSMIFLFYKEFISVILTLLLIGVASVSKMYKHFTGFSVGFELVTFVSIIFFFSHGFALGLILSILMLILSTLLSGKFSQVFVFQIMIYFAIGLLSIFLRGLGISRGGKILVIIYNIALHSVSLFLLRMPIHSSVVNLAVNLSVNIVLLDYFGDMLVELL